MQDVAAPEVFPLTSNITVTFVAAVIYQVVQTEACKVKTCASSTPSRCGPKRSIAAFGLHKRAGTLSPLRFAARGLRSAAGAATERRCCGNLHLQSRHRIPALLDDRSQEEQVGGIGFERHSYGTAKADVAPSLDHWSHKGLNSRSENSHLPFRKRERTMQGHRSPGALQRFVSMHSATLLPAIAL